MNEESAQPVDPQSPDLIGYRLGLLDSVESAAVAAELARSAELRDSLAAVTARLSPLGSFEVAAPAADLSARILARVRMSPRLAARDDDELESGDDARSGGPILSMRELMGLAAAVALMVGVFIPAFQQTRSAAQRAACAGTLAGLGMGFTSYAEANNDRLPYADSGSGPWIQAAPGAPAAASNSRQIYMLLRQGFVNSPRTVVCAARPGDRPMPAELVKTLYDFPSLRNFSYSSPLTQGEVVRGECDARQPLAGDHNPMFEDRVFRARGNANSDSHGAGAGQNVLRADDSVSWTSRTDIGPDGDDIMRIADLTEYTGWERPQFRTDTILVP